MRRGLVIAGFALLSVIGLVGWTRKPSLTDMQARFSQTPATQISPAAYSAPCVAAPAYPAEVATPADYSRPVYYQARPAHIRRVVTREYVPVSTVRVRHERPLSHSVAIVGAGAGTGAAIGALAGGGRGAGIGALSGGAAGFIYDRLTHNR